jgi:hypothetical protein
LEDVETQKEGTILRNHCFDRGAPSFSPRHNFRHLRFVVFLQRGGQALLLELHNSVSVMASHTEVSLVALSVLDNYIDVL